jgi:hypothetical protein
MSIAPPNAPDNRSASDMGPLPQPAATDRQPAEEPQVPQMSGPDATDPPGQADKVEHADEDLPAVGTFPID